MDAEVDVFAVDAEVDVFTVEAEVDVFAVDAEVDRVFQFGHQPSIFDTCCHRC